ncbi:DNA polymerase [Enterobacter phage 03_vB_Eclo_IJM]|nr:DNA polymerase [Enterobacter phage 03_vB_Eclo_IJM]
MNSEIVEGLYRELSIKRAELLDKLRSTFGSWYSPKGGKEFFKHPRTGQTCRSTRESYTRRLEQSSRSRRAKLSA